MTSFYLKHSTIISLLVYAVRNYKPITLMQPTNIRVLPIFHIKYYVFYETLINIARERMEVLHSNNIHPVF